MPDRPGAPLVLLRGTPLPNKDAGRNILFETERKMRHHLSERHQHHADWMMRRIECLEISNYHVQVFCRAELSFLFMASLAHVVKFTIGICSRVIFHLPQGFAYRTFHDKHRFKKAPSPIYPHQVKIVDRYEHFEGSNRFEMNELEDVEMSSRDALELYAHPRLSDGNKWFRNNIKGRYSIVNEGNRDDSPLIVSFENEDDAAIFRLTFG